MAITFTPAGAEAVLVALKQRGSGIGIRVCVSTGGRSGLSYCLEFADAMLENDAAVVEDGLLLLFDKAHLAYLDGVVIDYLQQDGEEGFVLSGTGLCAGCSCEG